MPILELRNVNKSYGRGPLRRQVLHDVSLSIAEGEFVAIVGFSGSGKTTLLSLIAGLITCDSGSIQFQGRPVTSPGPQRGLMFQTYALLPWLTALENVRLSVDAVRPDRSSGERRAEAERFLQLVGLTHSQHKRPHELSGGMRQRVALARTLAMDPDVLLLDEPLGALDALTRGNLQQEISRIWSLQKKTCVLITNDIDEALLLADRIIPLTPGPASTLGRVFEIDLERPRHPKELNTCAKFRAIRNELTTYLLGLRRAVGSSSPASDVATTGDESTVKEALPGPISSRLRPLTSPIIAS